jgi:hypothetical protein
MQTIFGWMAGLGVLVLLLRFAALLHVWVDTEPGRIGGTLLGILFHSLLIANSWMLHRRVCARNSLVPKPFWLRTFDVI